MKKYFNSTFFSGMIALIPLMLLGFGCNKLVDAGPPPDKVADALVFSTDAMAQASVRGLYSYDKMQIATTSLYMTNGGVTVYGGLSADELTYSGTDRDYPQFEADRVPASSTVLNYYLWSWTYQLIYQANACLEGLHNSTTLTPSVRSSLIGECLFVRSFFYFYLSNLFGNVPLITATDYQQNAVIGNAPLTTVMEHLTADLDSARLLMSASYPDGTTSRPNKWAATALLARLYVYQQEWAKAEAAASEVVSARQYQLLGDLNSVFLDNSPEALWQVLRSEPYSAFTGEGYLFTNNSTVSLSVASGLLDAFEPGDQRRTDWLTVKTVDGTDYYKPNKYKNNSTVNIGEESYMMMRYAELFLIRAEARARQGNLSGAIEDLDQLRSRAGLALYADTDPQPSPEQLLAHVEQERRVELFCEWGHRWLDLKRWPALSGNGSRADETLGPLKPDWQPTHGYFPLPQAQLQLNPFLQQNPGY
jgi:hypothetical protein